MARALKTYVTTSGFFELAVAAPSMKGALEIWGSKSNLFQQGFAVETDDTAIVKATLEQPGIVLRRAVGTRGKFKENAELPTLSTLQDGLKNKPSPQPVKKIPGTGERKSPHSAASRAAAELYDFAQKSRERDEKRAQDRRERDSERRAHAVAQAQTALEEARMRHEAQLADMEKEREALDRKAQIDEERWKSEAKRLEAALQRAKQGR